jgi:arylformamidase
MRFDDAFANSKYLAGAKDFPPRWAAKAAGFREGMGQNARLGQRMGQGSATGSTSICPQLLQRE